MKTIFEFTVLGEPIPMGSSRAFTYRSKHDGQVHAAVTSDNPRMKDWRSDIRRAAQLVIPPGYMPTKEPVALSLLFVVPKPASKPQKAVFPLTRPDLDKLARAFSDALTRVVWADDSQLVGLRDVWKVYAIDRGPGVTARISIVEASDLPTWPRLMGRDQVFRERGLFALEA